MFNSSLDSILKSFDKVSARLSKHIADKTQDHLELLAIKADIEDEIDTNAAELDRAERVHSRMQSLLA